MHSRKSIGRIMLDVRVSCPHVAPFGAQVPLHQREAMLVAGGLDPTSLKNLRLRNVEGDPVNRKRLEELKPERFTSVLILADEGAAFNARCVPGHFFSSDHLGASGPAVWCAVHCFSAGHALLMPPTSCCIYSEAR